MINLDDLVALKDIKVITERIKSEYEKEISSSISEAVNVATDEDVSEMLNEVFGSTV